jgi:hypothetical protein
MVMPAEKVEHFGDNTPLRPYAGKWSRTTWVRPNLMLF